MKGIYVLIIRINKSIHPKIGALGELTLTEGLYAYVGSAQSNLELRVARHLRKHKRLFWHIDYLLNNEAAKVIAVYSREGTKAEECKIARLLRAKAQPIAGFGCSDCSCSSHLFRAENFDFLQEHLKPLRAEDEYAELAQAIDELRKVLKISNVKNDRGET